MSLTVHLEIGHDATLRTKHTPEGFTHDWEVFVKGCNGAEIHYYVEKVVFYLHETFQKPKRVVKEPPFSLRTSGYAGFNLPIDIHLRNNQEPKKIRFNYDLQLQPIHSPPIHKVQKEKYTFHNPSEEFRSKLLKGGATLGVSSNSQESIDTNRLIDEKNQMTSKPRLSGSDVAKKHKIRPEEPKNSDFLNLFGTPITKTSRNPEPPKSKEAPKTVPKTVEKDKEKPEKAKSKSSHKDKEKKSENSDRKNRDERKKPKDEKIDIRDRSKEKSSKKDKSPVTKVHSPSPKRSPKRPASNSPAPQKSSKKDLEHLKEEKDYAREEKRDKDKERKDEKKLKKEKHKESKHKEREKEHKEHKNKESSKENKSGKEVPGGKAKEDVSPGLMVVATQSSQKTDKKEKLKEDRKESPKDEDKLRPDKPEQKHKHKKKDRKEKREEKHSKSEKRTEKQLNSAKHKENNKEPSIPVRETDKNNLFGSPKSEPPSTPVQEEERKAENNVSYKDDDSSNESTKVSSRETSPVAKAPTRSPSPVVQKVEAEKRVVSMMKKKEKKEKKKDKKGDKDHEKKKKRRSDTVTLDAEQPPTKVQKEEENHISDDESKVSSTEDVNTVPKNECDMDMLRELQHKIMSLKDNADLQKVVQLIAETGRYEVSANTFDFDLCLLDTSTVKQLQEFMSTIT